MAMSKQLMPIFDKPMIYYPLTTLVSAGIREILVITTPEDQPQFQRLLGDGSRLGLLLTYATQERPDGIAQAFRIGAEFIGDQPVALVLGDNIFHGHGLGQTLVDAATGITGCTLFGYPVADPERYGVAELGPDGALIGIEEKPDDPKSDLAITGLYFYDQQVADIAADLKPSARGEIEITGINNHYVEQGTASLVNLGRGTAWLDTGTHDSLLAASQFVQVLEQRQGITIACVEEVAYRMGYIDTEQLAKIGATLGKSTYGEYVRSLAKG